LASTDRFSIAAAMRARWHQLLKLSCVAVENSRDKLRFHLPSAFILTAVRLHATLPGTG
jgi:hypothetical protein